MKKSKKFLSLLLALAAALALAAPAFADYDVLPYGDDLPETADDHSDHSAAMEIVDDGTYNCILLANAEEDWYKIVFDQSGKANFWIHCIRPDDADLSLQLYIVADGKLLPRGTPSRTGDRPNRQAYFTGVDVVAGVNYYLRVSGEIGSASAYYTLRARRLVPDPPAPAGAEPESAPV